MAELDPRTAREQASAMKRYVESYNGQKWSPALDSPDRQNLAAALDHLMETAAMLMNMAERVSTAAAEAPAQEPHECESCWRTVTDRCPTGECTLGKDQRALEVAASFIKLHAPDSPLYGDLRSIAARIAAQPKADSTEPKPFPAPGKWFPIDVLGHPMREFAPGKWESATWPSEVCDGCGEIAPSCACVYGEPIADELQRKYNLTREHAERAAEAYAKLKPSPMDTDTAAAAEGVTDEQTLERMNRLNDEARKDTLEVFDGPETPQAVRDAIEYFYSYVSVAIGRDADKLKERSNVQP